MLVGVEGKIINSRYKFLHDKKIINDKIVEKLIESNVQYI